MVGHLIFGLPFVLRAQRLYARITVTIIVTAIAVGIAIAIAIVIVIVIVIVNKKKKTEKRTFRRILLKSTTDMVRPTDSRLAHFYGLPKTHKDCLAMRPTLSIKNIQLRLRIDGHNIENNKEMAEAFNIHFSTIADKLRNLLPDMLFDTSKLSNFVRSRKDESAIFSILSITEGDVVSYLLKIDSNKSTGIDDVSSRMLKLAAPFIAPSIAKLINLSFSLNVFPSR